MASPDGFAYQIVTGDVLISHRGLARHNAARRGRPAVPQEVEDDDPQKLMARVTGNYIRGNERTAKDHPRNQGR